MTNIDRARRFLELQFLVYAKSQDQDQEFFQFANRDVWVPAFAAWLEAEQRKELKASNE